MLKTKPITSSSARSRFLSLVQKHSLPGVAVKRGRLIWDQLESSYGEPHRHYHTLAHVLECLDELDGCGAQVQCPHEIEMALWFHDVIYAVGGRENERLSKELFQRCFRDVWSSDSVARIEQLIAVTDHSQQPMDNDQRFMCDIDLASFGKAWPAFLKDSEALVQESPHLDPDQYVRNKLAFLDGLNGRRRIYYTEHFQIKYEAVARDNIARYSRMLKQSSS